MMVLLALAALTATAHGSELPDPPDFEWSAPEQCRKIYGVDPGDEVPDLWVDGQARCSYVLVPVDVHADLLAWQIHGKAVRDLYKIRTTELEITIREGFSWRDDRIAYLEKPAPFMQRPQTQRAIGVVEATAAIVMGVIIVNHSRGI